MASFQKVVVLSKNKFIEVDVPKGMEGEEYYYATLLLHLIGKGWEGKRAKQVAEAAVYKRLYPGLGYGKSIEEDLLNMYREE